MCIHRQCCGRPDAGDNTHNVLAEYPGHGQCRGDHSTHHYMCAQQLRTIRANVPLLVVDFIFIVKSSNVGHLRHKFTVVNHFEDCQSIIVAMKMLQLVLLYLFVYIDIEMSSYNERETHLYLCKLPTLQFQFALMRAAERLICWQQRGGHRPLDTVCSSKLVMMMNVASRLQRMLQYSASVQLK